MLDIIIPIYNTPQEDLKRCFDSINKQRYTKYNVYLIDDGSKEETSKFLDNYTKKNAKYRVIHKKNGGVSSARNVGLDNATASYITFIDADDSISENFFEEAINILKKEKLDIVCGMLDSKDKIETNNQIIKIKDSSDLKVYNDKLISSNLTEKSKYLKNIPIGRIYSKIFKTKILKNIKFEEEITYSEDSIFCIDIMKSSPKIGIAYKKWYKYYENEYSILHRKTTYSQIEQQKKLLKKLYQRAIIEEDSLLSNSYKIRMSNCIDNIYKKMIKLNIEFSEFNEILNSNEYKFIKNISLKNYISIKLIKKLKYIFYTKAPVVIIKLMYLLLSLLFRKGEKNVR